VGRVGEYSYQNIWYFDVACTLSSGISISIKDSKIDSNVKSVSIDAIQKLARIVLTETEFIFEKKFCRRVIDGAIGPAFILILANKFMWKRKKELVRRQLVSNEIYGQ
jgi:hypothetical protein